MPGVVFNTGNLGRNRTVGQVPGYSHSSGQRRLTLIITQVNE